MVGRGKKRKSNDLNKNYVSNPQPITFNKLGLLAISVISVFLSMDHKPPQPRMFVTDKCRCPILTHF